MLDYFRKLPYTSYNIRINHNHGSNKINHNCDNIQINHNVLRNSRLRTISLHVYHFIWLSTKLVAWLEFSNHYVCKRQARAGSDHPKYNGCLMKKCFSRVFSYYCLGNACGLFGMTTSSLGHVTWIFCLRATGYTRRDLIEGHSQ